MQSQDNSRQKFAYNTFEPVLRDARDKTRNYVPARLCKFHPYSREPTVETDSLGETYSGDSREMGFE
jgi:hypothetical protein